MKQSLYLAWRYLSFHKWKSSILVLSVTLLAFVPTALRLLVARSADDLRQRSVSTPLLLGSRGSSLDLLLRTLYFDGEAPTPLAYCQVERIRDSGLAHAIPLHVRFHAREHPIVGTTLDYFEFRGLSVSEGRYFAILGECVLGSETARSLGLRPSDTLVSSPEQVFDLAGTYPLEMQIVGILAPSDAPDDRAVFVDLKTAWIIEGLGHGHADLAGAENTAGVLTRKANQITANASVRQFQVITQDNLDAFHFHGDRSGFPVTGILAVPGDAKRSAILQGRYQSVDEVCQILQPARVLEDLLGTVFTIQGHVILAILLVGVSTLALAVLVFLLSLRLRRRELRTMLDIGATRIRIASILGWEIVFVLVSSAALTTLLLLLATNLVDGWLRSYLQ